MLLPHKHQTIEAMKLRVSAAIEDPINGMYGEGTDPQEYRKHFFDFDDGMRIVLMKEVRPVLKNVKHNLLTFPSLWEKKAVVRVMSSIEKESPLDTFMTDCERDKDRFRRQVWARLWDLLGSKPRSYQPPNFGDEWMIDMGDS